MSVYYPHFSANVPFNYPHLCSQFDISRVSANIADTSEYKSGRLIIILQVEVDINVLNYHYYYLFVNWDGN